MKLVGEYKRKAYRNGKIEVVFEVEPYNMSALDSLENKEYEIDIKKISSKRTIRQNKYLWELINEICLAEDGHTGNKQKVYETLLKMAGVNVITNLVPHDAVDILRKVEHMYVSVIQQQVIQGVPYDLIQINWGSSTYKRKEMNQLIEVALMYASNVGVQTDYWKEVLND